MSEKGIFKSIFILSIMILSVLISPVVLASTNILEKGVATINAADVPAIVGIPENNIRFALWNGSVWYELPYSLQQASVQENVTDAITNVTSTVSTHLSTISSIDVFSVEIPAVDGKNASSSEWWETALELHLSSRQAIQLSSGNGYSLIIYAYYSVTGSYIPPNYASGVLPFVSEDLQSYPNTVIGDAALAAPATSFIAVGHSTPETVQPDYDFWDDPQSYSMQNIIDCQFSSSTQQSSSIFYLPDHAAMETWPLLLISWSDNGDPNSELLTVTIDGQTAYNSYISSSSSTSVSINPNSFTLAWWEDLGGGQYVSNTVQAHLVSNQGSWDVCVYLQVAYDCSSLQYVVNSQEYFAQYYKMPANSGNIVSFPTALPDGLVSEYYGQDGSTLTVGAIAPNSNTATLNVYILTVTGNWLQVGQYSVGGQSGHEYLETCDVSGDCVGNPSVTIGIQINSPSNWGVQGWITSGDRPCVAPDISSIWTDPNGEHTGCVDMGSLYYTTGTTNYYAGTYSTETDTTGFSTSNGPANPTFYSALTTTTSPSQSYPFEIANLETQVSVWQGNTQETEATFSSISNFVGASGGIYICAQPISLNEGQELLSLCSLFAGLLSPEVGPTLAGASLLLTYMSANSGGPTTGGQNTDTAYQQYGNPNQSYAPFSMLMKSQANLAGLQTGTWYTIEISTIVEFYCPLYGVWLTQLTLSNSFQYYLS